MYFYLALISKNVLSSYNTSIHMCDSILLRWVTLLLSEIASIDEI